MSLTFYTSPMSTASITELVIEELGIPCEKVTVDLKAKANLKPEFLAINPNGKVPVIVHDGTVIFESAAITMYLGEMFGVDKNLWPAAGPRRGEAMKWVVWNNVTVGDAVYRIGRNTGSWAPADEQNAKAAATAGKELQNLLGIVDKHLDGKQFLCGEFTLADAHVACMLDWLRHMKVDMTSFTHLNAWAARVMARPAYKKVNAH